MEQNFFFEKILWPSYCLSGKYPKIVWNIQFF